MVNVTSQMSLEEISEDDRMVSEVRADPDNFVRLYDRYLTPVYRYLVSRVSNHQDAEDLTSQVFLTAMERFGQFHGPGGSFAAWLFTIARNKAIDFFRTRHPELPLEAMSWYASEPAHGLLSSRSGDAERVLQTIQTLPLEERELLNLRFAAQMTYGEMARLLNRSEEGVKKQVYRLLKRIESQLEESHE